jgi:hypothetical protein
MEPVRIYKNHKFYCGRESFDDAQWELECIARSWRKNGGIIIEHNDSFLIVSEENAENETIFEIKIQ